MTDKTERGLMRLLGVVLMFIVSILIGVLAGNSLSGALQVVIGILVVTGTTIIGGIVIVAIIRLILFGSFYD
jgi:hypothetical protein